MGAAGPAESADPGLPARVFYQLRSRVRGSARILVAGIGTGFRPWLAGMVLVLVATTAGLWTAHSGPVRAGQDQVLAGGGSGPRSGADGAGSAAGAETIGTGTGATAGPDRQVAGRGGGVGDQAASPTAAPAAPPAPPAPAAPTGLTADAGAANARLCWAAAPGADAYTLYYRDVTAGQGWSRMPYPIVETCYTAQLLVNEHVHEFRLTGSNSSGESAFSETVEARPVPPAGRRPAAPTGLTVLPGNATARLCWSATTDTDAYALLWRDVTAGGAWTRMPYPIRDTCYTAQLLVNGHAYEFRVSGANSAGESELSGAVTATPVAG